LNLTAPVPSSGLSRFFHGELRGRRDLPQYDLPNLQGGLDNQDIIFLSFLKKDKKLYSSSGKIRYLQTQPNSNDDVQELYGGQSSYYFPPEAIGFIQFNLETEKMTS
jgi:hypothetical protein